MIDRNVLDQVEEAIDSFEENWSPDSRGEITALLEAYELTSDPAALTELIRIDIELRYKHGVAVQLDDYFTEFGDLLDAPNSVAQIAFEDYRSRSAGGHSVIASRWESLPGVKDEIWFQQLAWERSSLRPIPRVRRQRMTWDPDPRFETALEAAGFRLIQAIGEGAFSRVYLATQQELADRFVVLKVVQQTLAEPESMAMLQHTNIVPIYSFHQILSRSVICMPYAGSVTLRDFLKEKTDTDARRGESLIVTVRNRVRDTTIASADDESCDSSVRLDSRIPAADESAVLKPLERIRSLGCNELAIWVFGRLAAALAHSHARGVVHGDLKPGNVLIRNDGEPALLDFNLSQSLDRKQPQHIGGTLPYMAPESYRALMGQDVPPSGSSDIYGLGVMLFEFVTGRMPYPAPHSVAPIDLQPAIDLRRDAPVWCDGDAVSPGLRSIISQCIAFSPSDRYESAEQLQQDLEAERQSLPLVHASEPRRIQLRKWTRRHPRAILGAVAAALLLMLIPIAASAVAYRNESIYMSAQARFDAFATESAAVLSTVMVDPKRHEQAGVLAALKPLEEFGVLDGSGLQEFDSPKMTQEQRKRQRDTMLRHVVQVGFAETDRLRLEFVQGPLDDEQLHRLDLLIASADRIRGDDVSRAYVFLQAERARLAGDQSSFEALRDRADAMDASSDSEAYLDAVRMMAARQWDQARELLTALADRGSIPSSLRWTMLGRSQYNSNKYEDGKISITQSIEHAPKASRLRFMRGLCYYQLDQYKRAEVDFSESLELEGDFVAALLYRGLCNMAMQRPEEAIADFDEALELSPNNARLLISRSRAYRKNGHVAEADLDLQAALKVEDVPVSTLVARAQEQIKFGDPKGALLDLQEAHSIDPDAQGVLGQLGRLYSVTLELPQEAIKVFGLLLKIDPEDESALVDRAVLYARDGRLDEAVRDTDKALVAPRESRTYYQAACVMALSGDTENYPRAVVLLAKAFKAGFEIKPEYLAEDPDLKAIRHLAGYKAVALTNRIGASKRIKKPTTNGDVD